MRVWERFGERSVLNPREAFVVQNPFLEKRITLRLVDSISLTNSQWDGLASQARRHHRKLYQMRKKFCFEGKELDFRGLGHENRTSPIVLTESRFHRYSQSSGFRNWQWPLEKWWDLIWPRKTKNFKWHPDLKRDLIISEFLSLTGTTFPENSTLVPYPIAMRWNQELDNARASKQKPKHFVCPSDR